ncbi:DUF397 domain-containing protein [Streptomyces atroolivaceus]|uniref:DUF397 domain-containing protein n=1 Tax=Streptomyces atroolivaceus TaxID=66869 RepID=A0ABV9VH59_STRAZ|nr:DUF397 domain-containing protein [Streptomyces atroolivaceus]
MTTTPDLSTAAWRKASYSNGDGGECVEIADGLPGIVPVRDSKTPDGPALTFRAAHWTRFVEALRGGSL